MEKYFKIIYGFNQDEYLEIYADELPKAYLLFIKQTGKGLFKNGCILGGDIKRIVPDYHKQLGYNRGYKMQPEDYRETKPFEKEYRKAEMFGKKIAEFAIKNNRENIVSLTTKEILETIPELKTELHLLLVSDTKSYPQLKTLN